MPFKTLSFFAVSNFRHREILDCPVRHLSDRHAFYIEKLENFQSDIFNFLSNMSDGFRGVCNFIKLSYFTRQNYVLQIHETIIFHKAKLRGFFLEAILFHKTEVCVPILWGYHISHTKHGCSAVKGLFIFLELKLQVTISRGFTSISWGDFLLLGDARRVIEAILHKICGVFLFKMKTNLKYLVVSS